MRMMSAVLAAAIAAFCLAGLVRPAAAAAAVPGLAGEMFLQNQPVQLTHTCDANGTSTISYSVTGDATGPYLGTFVETGTVTIGPQNLVPGPTSPLFTASAGQVLTFDAQFTIDSAAGQVTGTKRLAIPDPTNQGACVVASTGTFLSETCTDMDLAQAKASGLQYTATIQSPLGTAQDSGGSVAYVDQDREICPTFGNLNESAFQETFYEVAQPPPPANTAGQVTGGGMIGAAPVAGFTIAFHAVSDGTTFSGNCDVLDHVTGVHVVCLDVTSFVQAGNTVTITGDATIDGAPTSYRIVAQDNGEPNQGVDTFMISTDSGYSAGGNLDEGNVQAH